MVYKTPKNKAMCLQFKKFNNSECAEEMGLDMW